MNWTNFLHYSGQILVVAILAELLLWALRVRDANLRIRVLQASLLVMLTMPLVQPRQELTRTQAIAAVNATPGAGIASRMETRIPAQAWWAIGAAVLLLRLAAGFMGLRRIRAASKAFRLANDVPVRIAPGLASPVTFGHFRPVILLPEPAICLADELRQPMIDHELEHVARKDWMYTLAEELIRAALWFHPAVWRTLAHIRAARELAVDQAIAARVGSDQYAESLLEAAHWRASQSTPPPQPAIAMFRTTASLRHRLHRIQHLEQETHMTPTHRSAAIGAIALALFTAATLVTTSLPLLASPAAATQDDSDTVKPKLIHKTTPKYPPEAKEQKIEGVVKLLVTIGSDGTIVNVKVESGDPILAGAAVEAVKDWEFEPARKAGKPVEVLTNIEIRFTLAP